MTVSDVVEKHGHNRENLLQILHDIQDAAPDRCLHRDALAEVASLMKLTVADVVGTASFYTMFSMQPRGRHIIRLCESPPCYITGSENILETLRKRLGIDLGETTTDGVFTLESTSCLGACGVAPVMSIDDEVYGNLTAARVSAILKAVKAADKKNKSTAKKPRSANPRRARQPAGGRGAARNPSGSR